MTLAANIQIVTTEFAKIERIDPSGAAYKKLCAILDQADDDALITTYKANIKFVSPLALNRIIRRGLMDRLAA